MATVHYNGDIVNQTVMEIDRIKDQFPSLASSIKSATNQIVSARGFSEYIGNLQSDTFSNYVNQCEEAVGVLIQFIRQKQIAILEYSADQKEIDAFLDTLTRSDYNSLDLTPIASYISADREVGNVFKGAGASAAAFGLGLLEGGLEVVETGADLLVLTGAGAATIFTGLWDLFTGDNVTERMWNETKAFVSEKHVENAFNSFYEQTDIGRSIKKNAYAFDACRGIGSGLGYTAGIVGLTALTCGAGGMAMGASNLATTAGVMGFSRGTEDAWADGANIAQGLKYGIATGAWEGTQFYVGAKINAFGGLGDKVSTGIFKGASSGVGTRIAMDAVDSGLEGFVQPALTMIYKDYGGQTLSQNYQKAFDAAGGWGNVFTQASIGALGSGFGEFTGARKLLKESAQNSSNIKTATGGIGELATSVDGVGDLATATAVAANIFNGYEKAKFQGDWMKYDFGFQMDDLVDYKKLNLDDALLTSGKNIFASSTLPDSIKMQYDSSLPIDQQIIARLKGQLTQVNSVDSYRKPAQEYFISSLVEAYEKGNTDALILMHKLAESGGLDTTIDQLTSAASGSGIKFKTGDIFSQRSSIVRHELGHYSFRKFLGEELPEQLEASRLQASANIKNNADAMEIFVRNYQKAMDNSNAAGLQHLKNILAEQGLETGDYLKTLEAKYASLTPDQIEMEFRRLGYTAKQMQDLGYDVLSDPAVAARREANIVVHEFAETIFRSEYNEYAAVGDILESIDYGTGRTFDYGHGAAYYSGKKTTPADLLAFHEQIANYTDMRLEGNTRGIAMLRNIIGDDYVDLLEGTYQRILKSDGSTVQARVNSDAVELESFRDLFRSKQDVIGDEARVSSSASANASSVASQASYDLSTPKGKLQYAISVTNDKKHNSEGLVGVIKYLASDDPKAITRTNDARSIMQSVSKDDIRAYISGLPPETRTDAVMDYVRYELINKHGDRQGQLQFDGFVNDGSLKYITRDGGARKIAQEFITESDLQNYKARHQNQNGAAKTAQNVFKSDADAQARMKTNAENEGDAKRNISSNASGVNGGAVTKATIFATESELLKNVEDPLTPDTVRRIASMYEQNPSAEYQDIVSLSSKGPKLDPDINVEAAFYEKFNVDNGYKTYDQGSYFYHVYRGFRDDTTSRIYLNVGDYNDVYRLARQFATECEEQGMGFYFKTGKTENGQILADITRYRDEAIVIYCGRDTLADYTNAVNKALQKTGITLEDPPLLTGRVQGTNIGIGAQPMKYPGRTSFNSLRERVLKTAYNATERSYQTHGIVKGSSQYYDYFKEMIISEGKKYGIDPNNFCLEQ